MAKDLLLDSANDLVWQDGDFVWAESEMQEVGLIVQSNQGDWKNAPLLGPNLLEKLNSNANAREVQQAVKTSLEMDNKEYNSVKNYINTIIS